MRKLISLGANLGDAKANLWRAAELLEAQFGFGALRGSHLYDTPPVGGPSGQKRFFNAVLTVDSKHDAIQSWSILKEVEAELGRQRVERWEARLIDLDLLLADQERLWSTHFKVPHPRMCMRTFILEPACEIAADWIEPISQLSLSDLAQRLKRPSHRIAMAYETPECTERWWQAMPQGWTREVLGEGRESWSQGHRTIDWYRFPGGLFDAAGWLAWNKEIADSTCLWCVLPMANKTADWERDSHAWAKWFGMYTSKGQPEGLQLACPRYLIPESDPAWGVHELIATFEAMGCEVHRLSDTCLQD